MSGSASVLSEPDIYFGRRDNIARWSISTVLFIFARYYGLIYIMQVDRHLSFVAPTEYIGNTVLSIVFAGVY